MLNKTVLLAMVFSLTGCGESSSPTASNWATLEMQNLQSEVLALVKAANPYPDNISQPSRELQTLSSTLEQKKSDIYSAMIAKCQHLTQKSSGAPIRAEQGFHFIQIPSEAGNGELEECKQKNRDDPETEKIDLQLAKIKNTQSAQYEWDQQLQKLTKRILTSATKTFAEQHGIELVIKRESESVLFNEYNVSVDITDGVLNQVKKMQPDEFRQAKW